MLIDDRYDRWRSDASTETDRRETACGAVHAMNWTATTARLTWVTTGKTAGVAMRPRKLDRGESAGGAVHVKNWTVTIARPTLVDDREDRCAMLPRRLD